MSGEQEEHDRMAGLRGILFVMVQRLVVMVMLSCNEGEACVIHGDYNEAEEEEERRERKERLKL